MLVHTTQYSRLKYLFLTYFNITYKTEIKQILIPYHTSQHPKPQITTRIMKSTALHHSSEHTVLRCIVLWCSYNLSTYRRLKVSRIDTLRGMFGTPRCSSARTMFAEMSQDNVDVLIREQWYNFSHNCPTIVPTDYLWTPKSSSIFHLLLPVLFENIFYFYYKISKYCPHSLIKGFIQNLRKLSLDFHKKKWWTYCLWIMEWVYIKFYPWP